MPSNYQLIKEENIRKRGEDNDDLLSLVSTLLYPDKTHFIYELIQNVEDVTFD